MSRNGFHQIARLATHPAFSMDRAALVCPLCQAEYLRVRDYDANFLAHQPDAELAWHKLSYQTYLRLAAKRGWPSSDEMLERHKEELR